MTSRPRYAAALTAAALLSGALVGSASPAAADDPPTLTVSDTTIADPTEGNSGSKEFTFDVTLTGTVTEDVVVSARTFAGSASVVSDFTDTLQELTFTEPGTQEVAVPVHGDHVQEADEDFIVRISSATPGVVIADHTGVAVIVNDDGPEVRIEGPSEPVTEPAADADPRIARFTIIATDRGGSTQFQEDVVVTYATVPVDGGAEPGEDYEHVEGTATLAPPAEGEDATEFEIEVPILGDAIYEGGDTEEFTVALSGLANGVWKLDGEDPLDVAIGLIGERDDPPDLSILDADVIEGDEGQTTTALVTVALSQLSTDPVSFTYSTRDGTGANAAKVSQDDYTPIAAGAAAAVPPLSRTTTVEVEVIGDDDHEDNEVFIVDLALADGEDGAALDPEDAEGNVTIRNDEGIVITVDDVTAPEGAAGTTTPFEFTVSLSEAVDTDVEVGYTTADGSATATVDYVPVTDADAAVTIPAGDTSAAVTVDVIGDDYAGFHEYFHLDLTATTPGFPGPTIMRARGVGTLLNDDGGDLTVDDVTVKRNEGGVLKAEFQVKLSEASTCDDKFHEESGCDVLVGYRTVDGSAKAGTHYTHIEGTLRIPRGAKTGTITVDVAGGTNPAPTRKFTLELDPAQFARTADTSVTATILNDVGPTLTIGDVTVDRPASGTTDARFPVTLSKATTDTVKVRFTTVDGTAKAGEDYVKRSGTLTIPPGTKTGTIEIEVVGDPDKTGADQTFEVALSDPDFARLGKDAVGKATIDNPPDPTDGDGGGGGTPPPVGEVVRTWGDARITTAVAVSRDHWATATDAVLATAWNYPDALAAGALAAKLGAPLLLTDREALPDEVAAELARLGAGRVWVMGGTEAVSQAVEDAVVDAGHEVRRLAGDDRFETAALVAAAVGASPGGEVQIALGIHEVEDRAWPDALAAGALAASPDGLPTLLTHGESLTRATMDALETLDATRVYLLGGTAAISPNVAAQLETLGYEVVRLAGDDRWGTSAAVATEALSRHAGDRVPVVFATGRNFPDGLAAGALAARLGALVVLLPPDDLGGAAAVRDLLSTNRARFGGGVVVGGPAAVTDAVLSQLRDALTSG
ncbi:MAG: cell wall-binding repeat-containing protein [Actinobacteria bacterium]|nr:cell wall-binding repeat-containing protein [Actinomycetota bacterium]